MVKRWFLENFWESQNGLGWKGPLKVTLSKPWQRAGKSSSRPNPVRPGLEHFQGWGTHLHSGHSEELCVFLVFYTVPVFTTHIVKSLFKTKSVPRGNGGILLQDVSKAVKKYHCKNIQDVEIFIFSSFAYKWSLLTYAATFSLFYNMSVN